MGHADDCSARRAKWGRAVTPTRREARSRVWWADERRAGPVGDRPYLQALDGVIGVAECAHGILQLSLFHEDVVGVEGGLREDADAREGEGV